MDEQDLKHRTKQYALRIIKLVNSLPANVSGKNIANQLMRAGTSVAANYRAACRSRSINEFISKLGVVIEEADEASFWLELIIDSGLMKKEMVGALLRESHELTAIMVASRKTAIGKNRNSKIENLKL